MTTDTGISHPGALPEVSTGVVAATLTAFEPVQIAADLNSANLITQVIVGTVTSGMGRLQPHLRAIVLTGSMARGEATFVKHPDICANLGDCEVVLVFEPHAPLPQMCQVADIQAEIERRLEQRCIACPVGLSPVHPSYLHKLEPHIYGYELRNCGRVIWGDAKILSLIPAFSPGDIPLEDAWRMICNRMIEQLAVAEEGNQAAHPMAALTNYSTIKLGLDLATSLLLCYGEYAPTYEKRSAKLQCLTKKLAKVDGLPFPLPPFTAMVEKLTRWKLSQDPDILDTEPLLRPAIWDYAQRLWQWELLRLTGAPEELANSDLMRHWMRFQPLHRQVRGWASLARKQGWLKSWRKWPHWMRLGLGGSPRYCIYAAGSELFFQLPSLVAEREAPCPDQLLQACREWLPVTREQKEDGRITWQQVASEIAWNYQQFLMETSS